MNTAHKSQQLPAQPQTMASGTLVTRLYEAKQANPPESEFSAKVKHVLFDKHFDPRGYDQCNLAIVLATFLAFIYSRSLLSVLVAFVAWFVFESIVWFFVPLFSPAIKRHVEFVESRDNEPVIDWLLFVGSLASAWYILEFTFVGERWRTTAPDDLPRTAGQWAALIIVVLVSLLSAFPDIYFLSAGITLASIFGVYFLNQTEFQLWASMLATIAVVYFYVWFKNPIAFHFVWNGVFALLSALFISSLIEGVRTV